MAASIERDLAAVARVEAVPTILRTIRESTGLRFTLVARVLPDRWVACAVHDEIAFGLGVGGELDVATTLCSVVRDTQEPIVIDEVAADPTYANHPTPKMYGFESYIAVPIVRRNGEYFGNLCGLDPEPRRLSDGKTLATLRLFSELISLQLDAEERYDDGRTELLDQRQAAELREEFIAVLGHDVRNPLGSITTGAELLLETVAAGDERRIVERIRASARRIGILVDDVLDLARGRLAGGIGVVGTTVDDIAVRLRHVVAEVQAADPGRAIELVVTSTDGVFCDAQRIEQLLSNLLANAVQHGTPGEPVRVFVGGDARTFHVRVVNQGEPLDAAVVARLFQPYFRGGASGQGAGLGLGLYIVSEIAKSHGGRVDVESCDGRTTFTFCMPRSAAAR